MFPQQQKPDPTTQGEAPWWQRAMLAKANSGQDQPQGAANNPWPQLGSAIGKFVFGAAKNKQQGQNNNESGSPMTHNGPSGQSGDFGGETASPDILATASDLAPLAEAYSDGQVVTKPTLAMVGENGPEAVVPMDYRAQAKVRPSMALPQRSGRNYYGG
jgi:hypothetical protein